jgi:hypothetical protein
MAAKLSEKKLDGKRLGFIALLFAVLFCASSLQVYRGERAESKGREAAAGILAELPQATRDAAEIEILSLSSCETATSWVITARTARVTSDYERELKNLVATAEFSPDGNAIFFYYSGHGHSSVPYEDVVKIWDLEGKRNPSLENYFYSRLWLEKSLQDGRVSASYYSAEKIELAQAYLSLVDSKTTSDDQALRLKLTVAEQQVSDMQAQVNSLKEQLAQASRSPAEKWIPLSVAILSVLIALSSHILALRSDRRQSREARLLPLKQQDLEHNIAEKAQQLCERKGKIIVPTAHEIRQYSRAVPSYSRRRQSPQPGTGRAGGRNRVAVEPIAQSK